MPRFGGAFFMLYRHAPPSETGEPRGVVVEGSGAQTAAQMCNYCNCPEARI